jgi:molybdopterin/thiamine biosynthesis adenylyltransferase
MAHVLIVGAGAIGSHLLPHLARSPKVSRVTLIDKDRYEAGNLQGQDISPAQVGRPKAVVQARRARRINPQLSVTAIHADVEDLPLGALRASVIVACVDSRKTRMVLNQAAYRLGVPWLDAGIEADGLLARVRPFVPAEESPCLECAWEQADYDALEQTYACASGTSAPTNAPSALAALAASLQAIECDKLLCEGRASILARPEVLLDARHHRHYVTKYPRNSACRMPDHGGWRITRLDDAPATLSDFFALGDALRGAAQGLSLSVASQRIVTEIRCRGCGASRGVFLLERQVSIARPSCEQCGHGMVPLGSGLSDEVSLSMVPSRERGRPLSELGLAVRDVVTLSTPEVDAHFELGAICATQC